MFHVTPGIKGWGLDDGAKDVAQWNKDIDARRNALKAKMKKATGYKKYFYIWWVWNPTKGKHEPETVSEAEFTKRLDSEKVTHVKTKFKNLAGDKKEVEAVVAAHKNSWDSSAYWHHTDEENNVGFSDGAVARGNVATAMGLIKPTQGTFSYASCIGSGKKGGGWTFFGDIGLQDAVGDVDVDKSGKKRYCQVFWTAGRLTADIYPAK
jgi:hypothetical protein